MAAMKLLYILIYCHTEITESTELFCLAKGCHTDDTDEHRLLFREAMIGRGVVLQKLRNVKTKNNWE